MTASAGDEKRIPHILLAEDDPDNRKAFGLLLRLSKFRIDFAEDGLQAVEMWEKGAYDLVIMDGHMPRLNGYEAARAIRRKEQERGGHTPIIAISAYLIREDEEHYLDAGMDASIPKPIDLGKFLRLVEKYTSS